MSGTQQSTMVKPPQQQQTQQQQQQQHQQQHKHSQKHKEQQSTKQQQYEGQKTTTTSTTTSTCTTSQVRQNFSDKVEHLINQLINVFLTNSYRCESMVYYFDREDVAQFGIANFHRWSCYSDVVCAKGLINYMIVRGGCVQFEDIPKPEQDEWSSSVQSFVQLLETKKKVYDLVLQVYEQAMQENDPHLTDFLEVNYIRPLANFNRKLGILIANGQLAGDGVGEYEFNKDIELSLNYIIQANKLVHQPGWEKY